MSIQRSSLQFVALATALILAIPSASTAQQKDLTLAEVYARLSASNPQLAAARSLATAASLRVSAARRPPDPQIQLGWMNYGVPNLAPMPALGMTQLQLMQMLPLGGKLGLAAASLS